MSLQSIENVLSHEPLIILKIFHVLFSKLEHAMPIEVFNADLEIASTILKGPDFDDGSLNILLAFSIVTERYNEWTTLILMYNQVID
jgi:hypothetical protein